MAFQLRQRTPIQLLRALWILAILYYEYAVFHFSIHSCGWPDNELQTVPSSTTTTGGMKNSHILLVADPQIVDQNSYPGRSALMSSLTRSIVDLNMKKSWKAALRKSPDAVVFLGDMMDGGRIDMSTEKYENLVARFWKIFQAPRSLPMHFIPGNHDIGIGRTPHLKQSPQAYRRYVETFGNPNKIVSIANHSLVLFDAPSYVKEDSHRHGQKKKFEDWTPIRGGSYEFLSRFDKVASNDPVVLFTHIPLYRPDGKNCGPLRERGTIRPGAGVGYQNTIEKTSSIRLLEALKPIAVFSGDDHDYCEYVHRLDSGTGIPRPVTEISVKSISMTMGVRIPGFQLLSLVPAESRVPSKPTYADRPCLLPNQLHIYLERYIPFFLVSVFVVCLLSVNTKSLGLQGRSPTQPGSPLAYVAPETDNLSDGDETSPSYTLPSPNISKFHHQPQAARSRGWLMASDSPRKSFLSRTTSFFARRSRPSSIHRRTWAGRCIRDVVDVAVPAVVVFVFINGWTVAL